MPEHYLIGLAAIFVIGMLARWIAWRLHLPSILLLLIAGVVVGPISGLLDPDDLFGNLLAPLVSMSVGVILFEGGLSLRIADLRQIGGSVRNLITIGVAVTWLLATGAAWLVVGLNIHLAVLLGAILVVSGPTVIIPLLHHVRPAGKISNIIRWEGILNDPIGALLAVLVFEAILAGSLTGRVGTAAIQFLASILVGVLVGAAAAGLLMLLLKYYLLPDFLQNPFSLTIVVGAFTASNLMQPESGFLATTMMGIVLANQKTIDVRHIVEFKENLRVLVISSLFVLLAARLRVDSLDVIGWTGWIFLALLILVIRPAAVWASTLGSALKKGEKIFLAWMAPRGIVAAAVASIFAERLIEAGHSEAERLVPLTFLVIIGTVAIYGLSAFQVAKRLNLAEPSPQGVLFVGAHSWAREMATVLNKEGFQVVMADSNWSNVSKARMAGLPTFFGGILSEDVLDRIDLYGVGRLMAMTSNDEANSLAALHFGGIFGRSEVYQLPPEAGLEATRKLVSPRYLNGRFLFGEKVTYDYLASRCRAGAVLKKSNITEQFGMEAFRSLYGQSAIPLFIIGKSGNLSLVTAEWEAKLRPGDSVIALVDAQAEA